MRMASLIILWLLYGGLSLICGGMIFLMTVFTSDNPANRAAAEQLMTIAFIIFVVSVAGGITAQVMLPGWKGWLIACGAMLAVPVIVLILIQGSLK